MTTPAGPNLVLIRHGETTWSHQGRHTGRTDLPLTGAGEAQASALRPIVTVRTFGLVLTSPLQRARRTADLAGLAGAVVDGNLGEWDYGEYEGCTTAEIRQQVPGWSIWEGPWPGGETIEQVADRADRVIARVRACPPGSDAVAVAHGHILRVLAARWIGASPLAGRWLALGTASWSELAWEHETPVIGHWNLEAVPQSSLTHSSSSGSTTSSGAEGRRSTAR